VPLKDVESWLKRGQYVQFLREICPRKKYTPKYNAATGIIAGELLIEFSKISHRIGKKLSQSSRTYAVKWQFFAENQSYFCLPASLIDPILKSRAYCSILINSFHVIRKLTRIFTSKKHAV
jgi:hypothetical protein